MARRKSKTLTEVELEFMEIVWRRGPVTTDEIQEALRAERRVLTGGTIRKVLGILVRKEYLTRRAAGRGFVYAARMPKELARRSLVRDLLGRAFGGSAAMMVASLFDGRAVRAKELAEIKRLIAEKEKGR